MSIVTGKQEQLKNAQRNLYIVGKLAFSFSELYISDENRFFRQGLSEAYATLVRCLGELSYTYDEIEVVEGLLHTIYEQRPRPATTQRERNLDAKLYGLAYIYDKFLSLAEEMQRNEEE